MMDGILPSPFLRPCSGLVSPLQKEGGDNARGRGARLPRLSATGTGACAFRAVAQERIVNSLSSVNRRLAAVLAIACLTMTMVVPAAAAADTALVNINTASAAQLETLPRIGPAIARRIIAYREENGPFKRPAELMNVKGIGESIFMQLKELITTGQKAEK